MKAKVIRHGDVSLHGVDLLPKDAKKLEGGKDFTQDGYVLAYGETTGHTHKLLKGDHQIEDLFVSGDFEVYEAGDKAIYVKVTKPTPLRHEEHRTIVIPEGIYEQKQEREEDPFSEAAAEERVRRVID